MQTCAVDSCLRDGLNSVFLPLPSGSFAASKNTGVSLITIEIKTPPAIELSVCDPCFESMQLPECTDCGESAANCWC